MCYVRIVASNHIDLTIKTPSNWDINEFILFPSCRDLPAGLEHGVKRDVATATEAANATSLPHVQWRERNATARQVVKVCLYDLVTLSTIMHLLFTS